MNLRFYVDPITEDLHIHNHGVREEEVDEVLGNARGRTERDAKGLALRSDRRRADAFFA